MIAYHVVTDRPMYVGQQIRFDEEHYSGVYKRVYDKMDINLRLAEIYWEGNVDAENAQAVCEILVDGQITVIEIVKEINANIESN